MDYVAVQFSAHCINSMYAVLCIDGRSSVFKWLIRVKHIGWQKLLGHPVIWKINLWGVVTKTNWFVQKSWRDELTMFIVHLQLKIWWDRKKMEGPMWRRRPTTCYVYILPVTCVMSASPSPVSRPIKIIDSSMAPPFLRLVGVGWCHDVTNSL
jgi:hypothetical protein